MLIIIAFVVLTRQEFPEKKNPTNAKTTPAAPETREQIAEAPRQTVMLPVADTVASLNSQETTAEDDIATLDFLISQFRKHQGSNPIGENDEITAALLGKNPKVLGYLRKDSAYINPGGQLIDRWGTPYFFHAVSGEKMDIISAGPDLKLRTSDDLTTE